METAAYTWNAVDKPMGRTFLKSSFKALGTDTVLHLAKQEAPFTTENIEHLQIYDDWESLRSDNMPEEELAKLCVHGRENEYNADTHVQVRLLAKHAVYDANWRQ